MPAPHPRSALAFDVGRRRIGLAGCDPLGLTVTRLAALARDSFSADLNVIQPLITSRKVQLLVVGLPLDARGALTPQARHCRRYGQQLRAATGLPLVWVPPCCWSSGCGRGRNQSHPPPAGERGDHRRRQTVKR